MTSQTSASLSALAAFAQPFLYLWPFLLGFDV